MLYHLNGIKQYISLKDDLETVIKNMTMKIFEVEDDVTSITLPDLLVIGYVISVTQHPNAEKLKICQIDCGSHGIYQICTGGENISTDHYVPVALPGCYLPAIDLLITPRPMRGEESNGMICSKEELGIKEDMDKHRIWHLDEDLSDLGKQDIGISMKDKYPRMENVLFEVKNIAITTRPDLTGYWGVACELNAVYEHSTMIQFNRVPVILNEIQHTNTIDLLDSSPNSTKLISLEAAGCNCYQLLQFDNVTITQSDLYQRMMVYNTGATPRNNWVDRSNNFMNLTGQPVHCFDGSKINGNITIKHALGGELFIDLLGNEHQLNVGDIIICDDIKIIALAGIIGGMNSCIDEQTEQIFVEVAQFNPTQIRKTATRLGLRTDAAVRFEKHINPYWTQYCSLMIVQDLTKNQTSIGNITFKGISHSYQSLPPRQPISISISAAQQFIWGNHNPHSGEEISSILQHLGFNTSLEGDTLTCMAPIWRSPTDITHKQDIYEEIARIVGYENIGSQPLAMVPTTRLSQLPSLVRKVEDTLVLKHKFNQVETYLWTEEYYLKLLGQYSKESYTLLNPLSPEQTIIRPMLYPGMIKVIVTNHRMHDTISIMETAHIVTTQGIEEHHVCYISYGPKKDNIFQDSIILHKNILSDIVGQYEISATNKEYLHPTKQGEIKINDQIIGLIGQIHPLICDELGLNIDHQLIVTEINLTALIAQYGAGIKSDISYLTNQHHIITRDVSFGLTGNATYEQILNIAQSAKGIDKVEVFDLYQPNSDLKTIGIRFTMVYDEAPSTESVTKKVEYIVGQIAKIEGVSVR